MSKKTVYTERVEKEVNGKVFVFINHWIKNYSGFKHETELYLNNKLLSEVSIQYYNRTWERYEFETSMNSCITHALDDIFELTKTEFKEANNIKRLTEKRKQEVKDICNNKQEVKDLKALRGTL